MHLQSGLYCCCLSVCISDEPSVCCVCDYICRTLCPAASVPRAQTAEAFPCGPRSVITFRHLFVNVDNAHVRVIAKSLPPFAASNNLC